MGEFLFVECQPQVDLRAQCGVAFCTRGLDVDARILLVEEVDAFVEVDTPHVETQFPETAFGLREGESYQPRHDRRAVAAFDAHVKRYAGAHLCLHARGLGDGFAVAVLLQYVVGSHVGAVDQFGDLQTGDFEHVLGLPQGTSGHIGHGDHLLAEGVDRDVDRASGFHFDAPFGQLVEDDAAFIGGDEQRVVDMQVQVVLAGDALGFVERHAREVGHGAPCAVARTQLHEDMRGNGHHKDDRSDQYEVPQQRALPEPGQEIFGFLHKLQVISGPSGKGRRR